jgi:uncharacterized protein (DUF1499 family)
MRRLIIEEPVSSAALWSRRLGGFALAVSLMSVLLARSRLVDTTAALSVFGAAVVIGCLAVLFALTAAVVIWRTGRRGVGALLGGLVLAGLLLGYPTYLAAQAIRLPLLNDVSTDLVDPPDFSRSSRATAERNGLIHAEPPDDWRQAQQRAYPDIQPIVLDLEADDAWQIVQKAIAARGWRIVDQVRPGGRSGVGHIDMVDRSLIMGFPDDITVRLRPLAGQTRIDIRSASRIGRHDFGVNARRIQRFAQELQTQLDAR